MNISELVWTVGGFLVLFALVAPMALTLILTISFRLLLQVDIDTPKERLDKVLNSSGRRFAFKVYRVAYFAAVPLHLTFALLAMSFFAFFAGRLLLFFLLLGAQLAPLIPFFIAGAYGLYLLRRSYRSIYGAIEVPVGIAAIAAAVLAPTSSDASVGMSDVSRLIGVLGGVYIIVRGLDNIDEGMVQLGEKLPGRYYLPIRLRWERWVRRTGLSREGVQLAIKADRTNLKDSMR
jgi:hypothetical protein